MEGPEERLKRKQGPKLKRRKNGKQEATAKAVASDPFSGRIFFVTNLLVLRTAKAVATHRFSGTSRLIYCVFRLFCIILDCWIGDLEQCFEIVLERFLGFFSRQVLNLMIYFVSLIMTILAMLG